MGNPPAGARFEVELSANVALYDVSHLLPTGSGKYPARDPELIRVGLAHKSGADGLPGFAGVVGMARFCTAPPPPLGNGRGWPGAPYTFWVSRIPDVDSKGRLVVYRCQPDNVRSWHTGGDANEVGVSAAMQGAYDGQWDLMATGRPKVEVEPTAAAMLCWQALWLWMVDHYHLELPEGVSGHWEGRKYGARKNKPVCPGDFIRQWIMDFRKGPPAEDIRSSQTLPEMPSVEPGEQWLFSPAPADLQAALRLLGYDPGPIDNIWGYRSRGALESFQSAHELEVDGWYGLRSARKLLLALKARGLADKTAFDAHARKLGWR